MVIRVGIVGVTGYTGEALIDILLRHPNAVIMNLFSRVEKPCAVSDIWPKFKNRTRLMCEKIDIKKMSQDCDVVFLSLPHTVSMDIVPFLLKNGKTVIDLSADYRLKNVKTYESFYKVKHKDAGNVGKAVYGLSELYRNKIKDAKLVANPGCYPTAAILGISPLVALNLIDPEHVIIDAKSGTTGAGKKASEDFLASEVNEDFRAYKVNVHQHIPEINQELSRLGGEKINVTFVPHVLPVNRGILETVYLKKLKGSVKDTAAVIKLYKKFYKNEPFIRIREEGVFPRLKDVVGTNFCDIGLRVSGDTVIAVAVIDNLLKGAAGQAVQNMNIIFRLPEYTALL
ncbi:MAG: N-acetyl-gamma-glutamyl-phosphate reductase [Candidatus Omnitrophica bacterium]|nr:N-acetyl-gamma-glutamyl-phosphate reductase [Candidatus Omnitrophota bacterium]